jgi:Skp family chaperone for outer membrane proteins
VRFIEFKEMKKNLLALMMMVSTATQAAPDDIFTKTLEIVKNAHQEGVSDLEKINQDLPSKNTDLESNFKTLKSKNDNYTLEALTFNKKIAAKETALKNLNKALETEKHKNTRSLNEEDSEKNDSPQIRKIHFRNY